MRVVELFNRIGRRAIKGGDFTKLSLNEKQDVATAANQAMQETYQWLPPYFKEMSEGFALPGPQAVSLSVVQFSNQLSSSVFTDAQIGCSVALQGDPAWNIVIASDRLLNPYMGPTGVASGTLYGDAWYSQRYPFDRVIGNPRFSNRQFAPFFSPELVRVNQTPTAWFWQNAVGQPQAWWPMMLGNAEGNEPLMVLRFSPAPDQAYSLNVRTSYWPKRLLPADYDQNTTIYVPDQFIETVLLPLASRALMGTPTWLTKGDEKMVGEAAERAVIFARSQPGQNASPDNRIFTPIGF